MTADHVEGYEFAVEEVACIGTDGPLDPHTVDLDWWQRSFMEFGPCRNYCVICLRLFRDSPRSEKDFVNCAECRQVFDERVRDAA